MRIPKVKVKDAKCFGEMGTREMWVAEFIAVIEGKYEGVKRKRKRLIADFHIVPEYGVLYKAR